MVNQLLLTLLEQVLGKSKHTSRGNYAFRCPNGCHPSKHKLEINLNTYQYQCWICGPQKEGLKGKSLINLFKAIHIDPDKLAELKPLVKYTSGEKIVQTTTTLLSLPKEFKSLLTVSSNDIIGKHALNYIKKRGITEDDILKYNIGYCEGGKFNKMIILPSYDATGKLNYFTARNFDKTSSLKYKNPDVSRNVIPFELFINWNTPIILCEGMFDAIAIKRNVIPLLGKNIQSTLMLKLVTSAVKKIYVALDRDALREALQFCEQLINEGKEVYLVDLDGKDPSELGFRHFTELIQNTYPLTFSSLLEKKLYLL
jgi:hypothetical protein